MKTNRIGSVIIAMFIVILMVAFNNNASVLDRDSLFQYSYWGACPGCVSRSLEISGNGDILYKYSSMASDGQCENHIVLQEEEVSKLIQQLLDAEVMKVRDQRSQLLDAGTSVYVRYHGREFKGNSIPKKASDIFMGLMTKYKCTPISTD